MKVNPPKEPDWIERTIWILSAICMAAIIVGSMFEREVAVPEFNPPPAVPARVPVQAPPADPYNYMPPPGTWGYHE